MTGYQTGSRQRFLPQINADLFTGDSKIPPSESVEMFSESSTREILDVLSAGTIALTKASPLEILVFTRDVAKFSLYLTANSALNPPGIEQVLIPNWQIGGHR